MENQRVVEFLASLFGERGELDAWLECNDESECREVMLAAMDMVSEACAKVCVVRNDENDVINDWDLGWYVGNKGCADDIQSGEWKKYMNGVSDGHC
jgi:hypothetical protein